MFINCSADLIPEFPYIQWFSTTDARSSRAHLLLEVSGLDGTGFYRWDDPIMKGWFLVHKERRYPCRCRSVPQSVEQAAREGVQEAVTWWQRAKEMAEVRGGSPYEYLTRTAPAKPQWATPIDFQPFGPLDDCELMGTEWENDPAYDDHPGNPYNKGEEDSEEVQQEKANWQNRERPV